MLHPKLRLHYRSRTAILGGLLLGLAVITGCGTAFHSTPERGSDQPDTAGPTERNEAGERNRTPARPAIDPRRVPETPREMRAVWIASVANIDWPSAPGLPVAQQKAELQALLDRAARLNMNAVFLQVRPAADALYDSPYEPWSEFLTGRQGRPPDPYYDPLAFAVEEAHRRGLELHAWLNPFRAYHHQAQSPFAPTHIQSRRPELVVPYGRYYWLNPGRPEARKHSLKVILDVARRYNVDGIHLDDYFYPYAEQGPNGADIPFPDDGAYRRYLETNAYISKGDWRRQNVNRFIRTLSQKLRELKPQILFGISPFGIWRPGHPPQIEGYDAYNRLYADSKKWINEGWVDYLAPQLYWAVDDYSQSFPVLLDWWERQNYHGRHLWPGLYTSRVGRPWSSEEIRRQIELARRKEGVSGHIHYSMQALMNNSDNIANGVLAPLYRTPALVPSADWISSIEPPQPRARLEQRREQLILTLDPDSRSKPRLWVVKVKYGDRWDIRIHPGWIDRRTLPAATSAGGLGGIIVSAVNGAGRESAPQMLPPPLREETASSRSSVSSHPDQKIDGRPHNGSK